MASPTSRRTAPTRTRCAASTSAWRRGSDRIGAAAIAAAMFNGVVGLFFAVGTGAALALSAALFGGGAITLGAVYLVFRYTGMLRLPLERLSRQMNSFQQATGGIVRVRELLATRRRVSSTAPARRSRRARCRVELDDVSFAYADEPVLRDVSFRVEPGEVLGLLGRTGSGKTTISRLLFRLHDPTAGAVRLGGIDVRDARSTSCATRIGLVTQDVQLFAGHAARQRRAVRPDRARRAPRGTVFAELGSTSGCAPSRTASTPCSAPRGRGLSAGEAQLVALARVFLKDPGLVVLDEASSRLDPATERLLERAVTRLLAGRTGVVIAHRLATVERADRILILEDGRVAESGRRADLAADPGSRFARLLRSGDDGGAAHEADQSQCSCGSSASGRAASWRPSSSTSSPGRRPDPARPGDPRLLRRALRATPAVNVWSAIALLRRRAELVDVFAGPLSATRGARCSRRARCSCSGTCSPASCAATAATGCPFPWPRRSAGSATTRESIADALDAVADLIGRSFFAAGRGGRHVADRPDDHGGAVRAAAAQLVHRPGARRPDDGATAPRREQATGRLTGFLGELARRAARGQGRRRDAARGRAAGRDGRRPPAHVAARCVFDQVLNAINFHLVHLGTGVVLLLGAGAISRGTFTVGDFALFVVFLDQLMYLPTEIGRLISDLKRIDVSIDRMHALVPGEPPEDLALGARLPARPAAGARSAAARERSGAPRACSGSPRRMRPEQRGLRRLVHPRARLVHGGHRPDRRREDDAPSRPARPAAARRRRDPLERRPIDDPGTFFVPPRSAYTPQVPRLFSETLRENLLLGRPDDPAALDAAIHAAVLEPDVAALERGLDTLVGPRGVKLSGGQVQRAAAARMFVREAELLVFDDLSSALDAETEAELWTRLFARGRDVTCLVVSHRPAALRRADQVLLMDAGRLIRVE